MCSVAAIDEMRGLRGSNEVASAPDAASAWRLLIDRLVGNGGGLVSGFAGYRQLFAAAYPELGPGDGFDFTHAARAIAAYVRTSWTSLSSPFDRYLTGDNSTLTDSQKRGGLLFVGKGRCVGCHSGPLFTDGRFHVLAVPQIGPGVLASGDDYGLEGVTGNRTDRYAFRTPGLRNVALTGPWMHDGSLTSLEEVVRHHLDPAAALANYDGSLVSPELLSTVETGRAGDGDRVGMLDPLLSDPAPLAAGEVADLTAFLRSLTDPSALSSPPRVPARVPSGLPVED
jgi:cytochrome c peroxidase